MQAYRSRKGYEMCTDLHDTYKGKYIVASSTASHKGFTKTYNIIILYTTL